MTTHHETTSYYTDRASRLMRGFEKMFNCAAGPIEAVIGKKRTQGVHQDARARFTALIPALPYVGGKKAPGTTNLVGGAHLLAIIQALEKQGLEKAQIGEIVCHTLKRYFERIPALAAKLIGWMMGTRWFWKKRQKIAKESQKREFPEAFVTEIVTGEDGSFDYGINTVECAIHKFYVKHSAAAYVPYLCLGDYPLFGRFGIGFSRTRTLGNGDRLCDFRFKKDGKTPAGWPPENLPEWKQ